MNCSTSKQMRLRKNSGTAARFGGGTVDVGAKLIARYARLPLHRQAAIRWNVLPLGNGLRGQTQLACQRRKRTGAFYRLSQAAVSRFLGSHTLKRKAEVGDSVKRHLNRLLKSCLIRCAHANDRTPHAHCPDQG